MNNSQYEHSLDVLDPVHHIYGYRSIKYYITNMFDMHDMEITEHVFGAQYENQGAMLVPYLRCDAYFEITNRYNAILFVREKFDKHYRIRLGFDYDTYVIVTSALIMYHNELRNPASPITLSDCYAHYMNFFQ